MASVIGMFMTVAAKQDLHHDATRDLRALGCHINIINNCQELDRETKVFGLSKDMQEGVLFMYCYILSPHHMMGSYA